jgi:hypothetical protein
VFSRRFFRHVPTRKGASGSQRFRPALRVVVRHPGILRRETFRRELPRSFAPLQSRLVRLALNGLLSRAPRLCVAEFTLPQVFDVHYHLNENGEMGGGCPAFPRAIHFNPTSGV